MNKFALSVAAFASLTGVMVLPSRAAILSNTTLFANADTSHNSASVTSLPYVTPVTASDTNATSIVTPDFTSIALKTTFSQTATAATGGQISGETLLSFYANTGDTYSVFGSSVPVGGTSSLEIQLYDSTLQQYAYHNTDGNVLFGTSSGNLVGGHLYDFLLNDELDVATPVTITNVAISNAAVALATNTGSGGITILQGISAPEPATAGVLMTTAGVLMLVRKRRQA